MPKTAKQASKKAGPIRIGIGGWTFPPWRSTFYPEKLPQHRELEYAASKLTSIEINGTYFVRLFNHPGRSTQFDTIKKAEITGGAQ